MRAAGVPAVPPVPLGGGLTGRVVASLDALAADGLAELPDGPVWTSPGWWRFVEADPEHEAAYLAVDDPAGRPLAVAPALLIRGTGGLLFYNGPRILGDFGAIGAEPRLTPAEREGLPDLLAPVAALRPRLYPSLTVGTFGSHFGLRPVAAGTRVDERALVPAMARLAAVVAERWGCRSHALLYLDPGQDAALREHAARLGLRRSLFGAEGVLTVPDGGFDGYLARLPSSRRNTIRREIRAYAELGIRTEVATGPAALAGEHVALRSALRAKYGHAAGEDWVRAEFDTLRETMGDGLVVFSARQDGRTVGYLMAFRRGDVLYTRAAGFDYSAASGAFCYFNLVYYDVVRWAQRDGVRRIHYGLGTSAAKAHRGCSLLPRWAYLRLPSDAPPQASDLLALQHTTAARLLAGLGVDTATPR
jgi:hypothetical protein